MSAGLSPQQFNAMARRRLQAMAKEVGGIYCRGQVLCHPGPGRSPLHHRRGRRGRGPAGAGDDRESEGGMMVPIDKIMSFEAGELDDEEVVELVQQGIDEGWVWQLQGSYGRLATQLLQQGRCTA